MNVVSTVAALHTPPEHIAKLRHAAQDFEAMTLNEFFAPIFDTVASANTIFGGGAAETAFRPMLVDAIAKQIAANGSLGLAGPIFDCLLRAQEAATAGKQQ